MSRGKIERRVVVGIDLGSSCGYSALDYSGKTPVRLDSGVWDFSSKHGGGGVQGLRMERYLKAYLLHMKPMVVGYEDVTFRPTNSSAAASRVYYGMLRTLEMVCESMGLPYDGINVSTAKKVVTGNGHAEKEQVRDVVESTFGFKVGKLDESDAVAVAMTMAVRMDWVAL
jgi:Holliday junction resolvasome RuvABC endonuclease subunit